MSYLIYHEHEEMFLARLLSQLAMPLKWCVELGAGDGKTNSNTFELIEKQGWSSVQIEATKDRFARLNTRYKNNQKVFCLNETVEYQGMNALDNLLRRTPMPQGFDFLSLDVDGMDYHIWQHLTEYRPRVVMVEFNPTIPYDLEFIAACDSDVNQGSSLGAFVKLANEKKYRLVSASDWNAFFVSMDEAPMDNDALFAAPLKIRATNRYATRLFQLFDGTLMLDGYQKLFWHERPLNQAQLQVLPQVLRGYPPKKQTSPFLVKDISERLNQICANLVLSGKRVAIYGTGKHTAFLFMNTLIAKAHVVALLDDDQQNHGRQLWGVPVISPQALAEVSIDAILLSAPHFQARLQEGLSGQLPAHVEIIAPYKDDEEVEQSDRLVASALKGLQYAAPHKPLSQKYQAPNGHYQNIVNIMERAGYSRSVEQGRPLAYNGGPLPWYTYPCIAYLTQFDLAGFKVFEWGCGYSSLFFAERCQSVRSIEASAAWAVRIKSLAPPNLEVFCEEIADFAECIAKFNDQYDIIIIDAERRLDCARHALEFLKPGGLVIVDNADNSSQTCAYLRQQGLLQVDFTGFGPVCSYVWTTSLFLKADCVLLGQNRLPLEPAGGLRRDLDHYHRLDETPQNQNAPMIAPPSDYPGLVSYAQEGEDILLEKVFAKLIKNRAGFYVDIGACDPVKWSLTYRFYKKGWSGINIDPRPGSKKIFDALRPRDTNLEVGVNSTVGMLQYHMFKEPVYNTFDVQLAEKFSQSSQLMETIAVPVERLDALLDCHWRRDQPMDFMSIDVEGWELPVLQSNNWKKYRPMVVALEVLDYDLGALPDQSEAVAFLMRERYRIFAKTENTIFFLLTAVGD